MSWIEELQQKISQIIKVQNLSFSYPPDRQLGDWSLACFELAKEKRQTPSVVAQELAASLNQEISLQRYFFEIKALGPYLNFFFRPEYLASSVISQLRKEKNCYGRNCRGGKAKVMIEYSNANTHKEYHVGHLRNISYGAAVSNLLDLNAYRVIPVSYINDFGIHVAKTLWYWQQNSEYQQALENKGYLLGKCYAAATQALEKQAEKKESVAKIMKEIESRRGPVYTLWQTTRAWSIQYFATIYRELEIKFRHTFYESEVIDAGLKIVKAMQQKGLLVKSEGAIIADLEAYDLGILPIIRSDGTALYPVADLALALEKYRRYCLKQSIVVVDVRQSLYFKQLAKILELYGCRQKLVHLAYDFVTLPEGMMSSRSGNIITYEELKNKIKERLVEETKKRHPDWTAARVEQVAFNLTISTIKFEMLKVSAEKIISFNINEALRFDGYTACYLQYGYVRLRSIVRKGGFDWFYQTSFLELREPLEKQLLLKISQYPEIIRTASLGHNPSEVAKYLFELVRLFNDYYHEVNILKAAPKPKKARLLLIKALAQVLQNGFKVLGLKTLEEM